MFLLFTGDKQIFIPNCVTAELSSEAADIVWRIKCLSAEEDAKKRRLLLTAGAPQLT